MLETHMHLLTNAIVGATYAGTITGFEREAKERAEAFRKAADAQVRTHASVEELRREVGAVKDELKFSAIAAAVASEGMKTRYSKERERPKNTAFHNFFR